MQTRWDHTLYDAATVGELIRKSRKQCKMTQGEMAQAAGIDRSYFGRIERGQVNLTLEKFYRLAHVLDCPLDKLLPG